MRQLIAVFDNRSQPTSLNRTDLILISTLYDQWPSADMPKPRALANAACVIVELNSKMK